MADLKQHFNAVSHYVSQKWNHTIEGVKNVADVSVLLSRAAYNRPRTALLCGVSAFAAATLPMAADGMTNFGSNLIGAAQPSHLYSQTNDLMKSFLLKNAPLLGEKEPTTDAEKVQDLLACSAGEMAGMIGGGAVTTIGVGVLTAGAGTSFALANGANTLTTAYRAVGLVTQGVVAVNGVREVTKIGQEMFSP